MGTPFPTRGEATATLPGRPPPARAAKAPRRRQRRLAAGHQPHCLAPPLPGGSVVGKPRSSLLMTPSPLPPAFLQLLYRLGTLCPPLGPPPAGEAQRAGVRATTQRELAGLTGGERGSWGGGGGSGGVGESLGNTCGLHSPVVHVATFGRGRARRAPGPRSRAAPPRTAARFGRDTPSCDTPCLTRTSALETRTSTRAALRACVSSAVGGGGGLVATAGAPQGPQTVHSPRLVLVKEGGGRRESPAPTPPAHPF